MTATPARPTSTRRRLGAALLGAGLLVSAWGGVASAKEIGSGGGGGTATATCSPVSSLTARSDARAGETGLATIDVSYGVKSCTKAAVTASVTVAEYANPAAVVYDNPTAALNGKFTVFGVKVRTTYKVTVSVYDAATGASVGSSSVYAAAIPKGV